MIDLWGRSNRDEFIECKYWKVSKYSSDNVISYDNVPDGFFFVKEIVAFSENNQIIGNVFLTPQFNITLESHDDLTNLGVNDIVLYNDKKFRVDSIQKTVVKKQRMFLENGYSNVYYITLRG